MRPRDLAPLAPALLLLTACTTARASLDGETYAVRAEAPAGFDRTVAQERTLEHLTAMVALDTVNPPGNEERTARYLDSVLSGVPGVETEVIDVGDGRANFVARLRATNPTKRPVLVMGHMDVVGAQVDKWTVDPFQVTLRDGYVYGRGVIDDKGMLAAMAAMFPMLSERRDELSRDVILLGTAAEEGGPSVGIDWIVENRPDVLGDAEFALNEGGRIRVVDGRVATFNVQTTEKIYYAVKIRATGPSGHGSVPLPDNALAALARAAARVHDWDPPLRLNETTKLFFERLSSIEEDRELRAAMLELSKDDPATRDAAAAVVGRVPAYDAILRTGCSLTMIDGGFRENVIPSEGSATFNVRTLPGEDIGEILELIREVCAEEQVTVELDGEPRTAPPVSPVGTDLFRAMESCGLEMAPGAVVVPMMSTGATDGAALRAHGIPTYGILPMPLEMEDELRMHGDDERAPLPALGWAAEYVYRVLSKVAE